MLEVSGANNTKGIEVALNERQLDLATAAAHSLGTPLATISVVATELKKEIGENTKYS